MYTPRDTTPRPDADAASTQTMHAVRAHTRGGPERLVYEEAPLPTLLPGDALVRVRAVGISPGEFNWNVWEAADGTSRLPITPGHEVAGAVAAVTPGVDAVAVGDAVFALTAFARAGAAAEYVAVRAADLAPKPATLTFAQAAATPLSALTAWQALITHGELRAGQRVLIHGAAGGVGTFAVQIARSRSAHIIGTASGRDEAFLRALGCDEVIDYRATRFEEVADDVDVVFDTVGGDTTERSWGVLRPGGVLVTIAAPLPLARIAGGGPRGIFFVVEPDRAQLLELARLIDAGAITPIVEAVMPLPEARHAYERGLQEHPRGKLVLSVGEDNGYGQDRGHGGAGRLTADYGSRCCPSPAHHRA